MQDPRKDITNILRTLCTTRDGNELEELVVKYYAPDAKMSRPQCKADSRDEILGVFQYFRLASPQTTINRVADIMYDADTNILICVVDEQPHWLIPLPTKSGRMLVRLQLRKMNGCYYIVHHEEMAHPMDQVGFVAAPLVPLVAMYLWLCCLASNLSACVLRAIGLDWGLRGGTMNWAGLMRAARLARMPEARANGNAKE